MRHGRFEGRRDMGVSHEEAQAQALALEGASATPHFNRTAFRTPRRIFATLANDGDDMNFMFDHALQEFYCEQAPEAFAPVPGGWGRMGATRCQLSAADPATFTSALIAAHALACQPPPRRAKKSRIWCPGSE
jgi:hypothetical protein